MPCERQTLFLLSLQSRLPHFRRTHQEQIPSNSHCYLSVLYVSLSLPTECKFKPTFLQKLKLHWLISTLLLLPPDLSKSLFHRSNFPRCLGLFKSPIMALLWKWTFLSDPILCTVLLGNLRTADVSDYWNCGDDCQKPETVTFPWVVISPAGGGEERWFMTIH